MRLSRKNLFFVIGILSLIFITNWIVRDFTRRQSAGIHFNTLDLRELESFDELSNYFALLAKEKGAEHAFEILKTVSLQENVDIHLLAHGIGDELYKQQGLRGIHVCTNDFRNACSHSIVIGLFYDKGEEALPEVSAACRQAPGGRGAYTMCFHGLGHGILAYTGYDLPEAVGLCKKTGTPEYGRREFHECVGGMTMEMIAGVHNREQWQRQYQKYFKENDPLYPCSSDFIPYEAKYMCYVYITPHLFKLAGADIARPQPDHFDKAFTFCDAIPERERENRKSCYGGFGKEFIVLVQNRDIRKIETLTEEQLNTLYRWCMLTDKKDGQLFCVESVINSLFWGGENDASVSIHFCSIMEDRIKRSHCVNHLIGNGSYYLHNDKERESFCNGLPGEYRHQCETTLLNVKSL